MKILKRLFQRPLKETGPHDVMTMTDVIGPLIDRTTCEIFLRHREVLLKEPITYIVPAV